MQLQVLQKWWMWSPCYRRFILFQCTRTRLVKRITRGFCLLNNLSTWTLPPDRIVFGFFLVDSWEDSTESWHYPFTFVITQARPVFVSLWAWAGNEHKPNLNSKSGSRTCRTKLDLSPSQTPAVGRWPGGCPSPNLARVTSIYPCYPCYPNLSMLSMDPCIHVSCTYRPHILYKSATPPD